jgi:hypothetical protein
VCYGFNLAEERFQDRKQAATKKYMAHNNIENATIKVNGGTLYIESGLLCIILLKYNQKSTF